MKTWKWFLKYFLSWMRIWCSRTEMIGCRSFIMNPHSIRVECLRHVLLRCTSCQKTYKNLKNVQYNVTLAIRICTQVIFCVKKFLKWNVENFRWDVLQVLLEPNHKYVYIFGAVYICGDELWGWEDDMTKEGCNDLEKGWNGAHNGGYHLFITAGPHSRCIASKIINNSWTIFHNIKYKKSFFKN